VPIQNWQAQIAKERPPSPAFADRGRLEGKVPIGLSPRSEDCCCSLILPAQDWYYILVHLKCTERRRRLSRHSPQLEKIINSNPSVDSRSAFDARTLFRLIFGQPPWGFIS
jgi:hypothetical protein